MLLLTFSAAAGSGLHAVGHSAFLQGGRKQRERFLGAHPDAAATSSLSTAGAHKQSIVTHEQ